MNQSQAAQLCQDYDLGEPVTGLHPVTGGLLHKMWRLDTGRGSWAVKELNPAIISRPGLRDEYRRSEQIAARMLQAGVPAVCALQNRGDWLYEVEGTVLMIFDWVAGVTLGIGPTRPEQARQIGEIMARIHRVGLEVATISLPQPPNFSPDHWADLVWRGTRKNMGWAENPEKQTARLVEWSAIGREARLRLSAQVIISHRDLDQKNVIWRDRDTPLLIDWEAAGLVNPALDVIGAALSWSGLLSGQLDEAAFKALLQGYCRAGGAIHEDYRAVLQAGFSGWLGWLEFNMRRSIDEESSEVVEQQLGLRECIRTIATLELLSTSIEGCVGWLSEIE